MFKFLGKGFLFFVLAFVISYVLGASFSSFVTLENQFNLLAWDNGSRAIVLTVSLIVWMTLISLHDLY
jgi:hypothetical protein